MSPDELLRVFADAAGEVRAALEPIRGEERRARTAKPGQYAIDLVADRVVLEHLKRLPVAIVSEESDISGDRSSPLTVVVDPVDGSSNAARHIPYWSVSLCALDADGPVAALVVNGATGVEYRAARGKGATRAGEPMGASTRTRVEDAFVGISSLPGRIPGWKQFRALGSCALALCDVGYGALDGYVDSRAWHAPWDYLGGLLVCLEAGAHVVDAADRPLAVADPSARRQLVAAGTEPLLAALRAVAG